MIKVPDGEVTVDGKKTEIKGLWVEETEVPFQLFEVWSARLDLPPEKVAQGAEAESRPSKPYAIMYTNFGNQGFPAICMSFKAANDFCAWLSAKTGKHYRLPTEAEWEYMARAGQPDPSNLDEVAWFWDNSDDTTHKLGSKKPNAWGIKDVLGNVAEWCTVQSGAPVVRGGSWRTKSKDLKIGLREAETEEWNEDDPQLPKSKWWLADGQFVGMRLVCDRK